MITELTQEQKILMLSYQNKWINKIGKIRLNKEKARQGINFLYQEAGMKLPKSIIFVDSPLGLQYAYALLKKETRFSLDKKDSVQELLLQLRWSIKDNSIISELQKEIQGFIFEKVGTTIGYSIWNKTKDSVYQSLNQSVSSTVWRSVWRSVKNSMWEMVRLSENQFVWELVEPLVWESVKQSINKSVWRSAKHLINNPENIEYQSMGSRGSINDWNWVALYSYYLEIGIELPSEFAFFCDYCCLSGIYDMLPYEDVVIVCGHPKIIYWEYINDYQVASSTNNAAIKWKDGFSVYIVDGVLVSKETVLNN